LLRWSAKAKPMLLFVSSYLDYLLSETECIDDCQIWHRPH
jgi:hypothetical protein